MAKATLHIIGLPHTQTTHEFDHCAYTAKVRKFCGMMRAQGYEVILYAGDENEADCDELVTCVPRAYQEKCYGDWWHRGEVQNVQWYGGDWDRFNQRAVHELKSRVEQKDLICLITGHPQQEIISAFPEHLVVEFGVGYEGIAASFQVYESYAWMHCVYGAKQGPMTADGRFFDAVIPNYYDTEEFPECEDPQDYYVFMSRMTPRKGYEVAIQATEELGVTLKIAGVGGDRPEASHVEYVGLVGPEERGKLLSQAKGVFMPTLYLEPFGGVAAEAMLCGTPVISSDWGAFPELITQGVDGYRCRTMGEFIEAGERVEILDRRNIRNRAQARFSLETVGAQYKEHFNRLGLLWDKGFYDTQKRRS